VATPVAPSGETATWLRSAAAENKALRRYLKYNGYPDVAEMKPILDQPPWDDHEVTLYYFKSRKEISFARARVLGRPEVYSTRYERVMTDAEGVRNLVGTGLIQLLGSIMTALLAVGALFYLNWKLTTATLIVLVDERSEEELETLADEGVRVQPIGLEDWFIAATQ